MTPSDSFTVKVTRKELEVLKESLILGLVLANANGPDFRPQFSRDEAFKMAVVLKRILNG